MFLQDSPLQLREDPLVDIMNLKIIDHLSLGLLLNRINSLLIKPDLLPGRGSLRHKTLRDRVDNWTIGWGVGLALVVLGGVDLWVSIRRLLRVP